MSESDSEIDLEEIAAEGEAARARDLAAPVSPALKRKREIVNALINETLDEWPILRFAILHKN
jgi:hypothetical protein